MDHPSVLLVPLVAVALYAAPSSAEAAISAKPAIKTRDGATRLAVTLTSSKGFTARTRPRRVKVVVGTARYVLRRSAAGETRSMWNTPDLQGARGAALKQLAGKRVAIKVRTLAGTTTLLRRVPPSGTDDDPPNPPPSGGQSGNHPPGPPPTGGSAPSKGEQALGVARMFLGQSYLWGGSTPATGFDASGLMQYSYGQVGIKLPRTSDVQFQVGVPVPRDALRLGDLVFFRDSTGYVHHVGMFAGSGQFIHAPHTADVVKYSSLNEPYYSQQFAGGRRIVA